MPGIPNCRLQTYRPTSTTVRFTVSTRAPIDTFAKTLYHHVLLALRFALIISIVLILVIKWVLSYTANNPPVWLADPTLQTWVLPFARNMRSDYFFPAAVFCLWLLVQRGYKEESLLILRGLGIQTTSSAKTYLSKASTRFIPTTQIQDIFIHEAFKGFEVRFYLSIVVKGEEDVVVVYPNLLPGLTILEEVWRGARACLYEPKS